MTASQTNIGLITCSDSVKPDRKILQPSRNVPAFFTLLSSSSASQSAVVFPLISAVNTPVSPDRVKVTRVRSARSYLTEHGCGVDGVPHTSSPSYRLGMETSSSLTWDWSCLVVVLLLVFFSTL